MFKLFIHNGGHKIEIMQMQIVKNSLFCLVHQLMFVVSSQAHICV